MAGVGLAVRHDQNLAGTGDHIDGNGTEHLLFGFRHKGVAGADDLIHLGHAFGAVGQGGNGLGAAYLEDLVDAGDAGSCQDHGIDLAVSAGGRDHDHLSAPGDLGGDGVHQHGGGVGRCAAGHIQTGPVDGDDLLTHYDAVFIVDDKAAPHLGLVELADIRRRAAQNVQKLGVHRCHGFGDLLLGHLQSIQPDPVKLFTVFIQSLVAVFPDIGDDLRNDGFHIHGVFHPGKDLLRRDFPEIQYSDHLASSIWAEICSTNAFTFLLLNW